MDDEPLGHLERPRPSWSGVRLTVCGRSVDDVARLTTVAEVRALVSRDGKRRAAYSVCMTCWDRHRYHMPDPPAEATALETLAEWVGGVRWGRSRGRQDAARRAQAEVTALDLLVAEHRDEYDEAVRGLLEDVATLNTRRTR